ncbi:MAG TPA: SEC-C domain-containing protein [Actinomycetospora sp.]|uniref:SEC-C domain-containing protein n=1 Tax=Actinomycetospora sp. TaxID=1872135 RepID=UPI002F3F85B4
MAGNGVRPEELEIAEGLEADAADFPEERGELLLEAVTAWRRGGRPDRAYELIDQLVTDGGPDGCFARAQRIDHLYEDGRDEDAATEVAALARDPALSDGPCQIVAELFAEREDLEQAAAWYDRAVARLDDEAVQALHGPHAAFSFAGTIVQGRREVREALGLPPDRMDELVPESQTFPWAQEPPTRDDVLERLEAGECARVQLVFFQRRERAEAQRRWPDEYPGTDEEYFTATELGWRELRDAGAASITVVPLPVSGLVAFAEEIGKSPTDSAVKNRYSSRIAPTAGLSWPPPRNGPCWCGSGGKYKKCCGRPGLGAT